MGDSCFRNPHSLMAREWGKRSQTKSGVRAGSLCNFPDPSVVKPQGHCTGILSSAGLTFQVGGLSSCRRTQRYPYIHPLTKNQDPALITARLFPDYSSLSLYPLPSLISSCLKLPFGTQGRPGRLHEACFLQTRNEGRGKDLYPEVAAGFTLCCHRIRVQAVLVFQPLILFKTSKGEPYL